MLYRPAPRFSFSSRTIGMVQAIAGLLAAYGLRRTDNTYLDGLNADRLRDLGLNRVEARDYRRYY